MRFESAAETGVTSPLPRRLVLVQRITADAIILSLIGVAFAMLVTHI
jgi:hypothetical protein